jgi:hypothetical protein
MNKPNSYDTTRGYEEFTPLDPGGYVCKIKQVIETKSSTGKEMIEISLDVAEGENRGYYANQFRADTREKKKWGCIVYQLTEDKDGNCNRGLKSFIDAVTASNKEFNRDAIWGDNFANFFKDRLVGGLFHREQYENRNSGKLQWSTKCFAFRAIDVIRAGVEPPEDKPLVKKESPAYMPGSDFSDLTDSDEDLPF